MNSVHKICFRKMDYEVSVYNVNGGMQMEYQVHTPLVTVVYIFTLL